MPYIKHFLFSLFLWSVAVPHLSGQNLWRNTSIVGGGALGKQDRRLFYWPPRESLLARNPPKADYDLTLYIEKRAFKWRPLELDAGIGYSESNTLFSRPFRKSLLNGGNTLEGTYIKKYTINKLILPVSGKIHIGKFYLHLVALPAFSFRKSGVQITFAKRFTKWEFAWNGIEVNPGIGFQLKDRIQISVNYRWLYYYKIDKVIFNSSLFYEPYPEFLQQKADAYNPFKMWLTVGYKLKK